MPTKKTTLDHDDDGALIAEDPFFGADVDDEENDENVDFGDEVDGTPAEEADEEDTSDDKGDENADEDDAAPADDAADDVAAEEELDDADTGDDDDNAEEAETEPKENGIPRTRFNEVNERRKAAEAELEALKATQAARETATNQATENAFDFDSKEREYMELTVDGEFDKALAVRNEIRAAEKAQFNRDAQEVATQTREATKADLVFQDVVVDLEAEYPAFDSKHEDANQDLIDEVLILHQGFLNDGMAPTKAIRKAVMYVAKANDVAPVGAEQEAAPAAKAPTKKTLTKKEQVDKAEAKANQPPQLPKDADREASLSVEDMSEDEWDALPESKKKQLRGDYL